MNIRRIAATLAATAVSMVAGAQTVSASVDVSYGRIDERPFVFTQTSGDCEEAAADIVLGAIRGHRLREATIEREALKLGVGLPAHDKARPWAVNGSNWFSTWTPGLDTLLGHYGVVSKVGSHGINTLEADLAAGDHLIAFVNAETIWAAAVDDGTFAPAPAGTAWNFTPGTDPDHALVVDQIDATAGTVTLSDSGPGVTETVPLGAFIAAYATSGYSVAVVTTK